jgi:hypothetical protein
VKNKANTWFLYAVCRTPIWKEFIKISYEKKGFTEDQHFAHEWLMFKLSKAMFRTKHLNTLTLIRQHTIEGANVGPKITWTDWLLDESNNHLIEEIEDQLMKAFNFVSSSADEENLKLAKSVMALERERVSSEVEPASNLKQRIKTIFVGLVFKVLPNLKVFSDRPHKLKDCWEMLDATGLSYERLELEFINELLLKPREELRLRVDI